MYPFEWLFSSFTSSEQSEAPEPTPPTPQPPAQSLLRTSFLATHSASYNSTIEHLLPTEYPHLHSHTYLDHAGATPYPSSILTQHTRDLLSFPFSNPHSAGSPSASATQERITAVRGQVLRYLNADPEEYAVVFTKGATDAARIVGEGVDWGGAGGEFWYLRESHTSVVGIRSVVEDRGGQGRARVITAESIDAFLNAPNGLSEGDEHRRLDTTQYNLLAFPAQCNATGTRYPLNWVTKFRRRRHNTNTLPFLTLLDAASYLSTSSLDLTAHPADFTILSFYKIFGFPTGLGALIIRRSVAHLLNKSYFGGGTVSAISVSDDPHSASWHEPKQDVAARFEDGTLPFLQILALAHGFTFIESTLGGITRIGTHALCLRDFTRTHMSQLTHPHTTTPLCVIYESPPTLGRSQGPILCFNLLTPTGAPISPTSVLRLAAVQGIHLRAGCFCNPGACQQHLCLTPADVRRNHELHGVVCGGEYDIVDGTFTGCLRISFGACSSFGDVENWIQFLTTYYLSTPPTPSPTTPPSLKITITSLHLYPIKSCAPFSPPSWPLTPTGLHLDRAFALVDAHNTPLTLKRFPAMANIRILDIDLVKGVMTVNAGEERGVEIALCESGERTGEVGVCTRRVGGIMQGKGDVDGYFSTFLGVECRLMRSSSISPPQRSESATTQHQKSFANTSPLLITTRASFDTLHAQLPAAVRAKGSVTPAAMRANIILSGVAAWGEDAFLNKTLHITNPNQHKVEIGVTAHCTRCAIVNVDNEGAVGREPYSTLGRCKERGVDLRHLL
ncbi:pyridoxal phosphate-dependent transferase [Fimicolochytrium jonesii]|uniref:pyridoxal phosphate-dependent transferase n=1 Tax=Fimicolochytrium jonesii TaxID=1396493 RepID=UPI0022FE0510|nr:pyridoxal phosphate-dependent transferase [Fimicolochytrium jonesii]KAI8821751.1 pyridoxal phosphate-dependent transferase [Fimicolochytrium jonesii]